MIGLNCAFPISWSTEFENQTYFIKAYLMTALLRNRQFSCRFLRWCPVESRKNCFRLRKSNFSRKICVSENTEKFVSGYWHLISKTTGEHAACNYIFNSYIARNVKFFWSVLMRQPAMSGTFSCPITVAIKNNSTLSRS